MSHIVAIVSTSGLPAPLERLMHGNESGRFLAGSVVSGGVRLNSVRAKFLIARSAYKVLRR